MLQLARRELDCCCLGRGAWCGGKRVGEESKGKEKPLTRLNFRRRHKFPVFLKTFSPAKRNTSLIRNNATTITPGRGATRNPSISSIEVSRSHEAQGPTLPLPFPLHSRLQLFPFLILEMEKEKGIKSRSLRQKSIIFFYFSPIKGTLKTPPNSSFFYFSSLVFLIHYFYFLTSGVGTRK